MSDQPIALKGPDSEQAGTAYETVSQIVDHEYPANPNLPLTMILPTFPLPTGPPSVTVQPNLSSSLPFGPALATGESNGSAILLAFPALPIFCLLSMAMLFAHRKW
ncbi:hypothetical protein N7450_011761 [Penicillium hetheringtonii]|uniref:Uncharacterized protein n=1 Tax=Penicillium hetheringtonii TaxID=911720 RepID=A0AAD6DAN3_9EURO|nr:hypothetical protein N7450_011761 [Penicillium hetheringtonii]